MIDIRNDRFEHRPIKVPCEKEMEKYFSYFVRFLRKRIGCTQAHVANLTGLSPAYVSGVENGQAYRNIVKTHRIIYTLGFHPETIHECVGRVMELRVND